MEKENVEEARRFWNRFDDLRGTRTVKEIADAIGIEYELVRVQRTRKRVPKLSIAVGIAKELGTTVEYLACGTNSKEHFMYRLYNSYLEASHECRKIVDIALSLNGDDQNQMKKMSV